MIYVVKKGDCLSVIAKNHGISLKELLDNNPRFKSNPDLIPPGDQVYIPDKPTKPAK